ncbi:MAG TPA: hypothetical protein VM597_02130 [Gemmataceae bacterium]|nr:hypothetical protein [Gemmataceae bacterium]
MRKPIPTIALGFAIVLWTGAITPAAAQEKVGTSVSHESANYAAFSVTNSTTGTLYYQVRWGKGEWKETKILTGQTYEHRQRLNAKGEFQGPQIRFDRVVGDNKYTNEYYDLDTKQISKGGFGPPGRGGTPKPYVFKASADRRTVDLYAEK